MSVGNSQFVGGANPQALVLAAMHSGAAVGLNSSQISHIETFISDVFLTDPQGSNPGHAVKIKKPINWGWLDYSTKERRLALCQREIERNAPNAPGVYQGVRAFKKTDQGVHLTDLDAPGETLEYALLMTRLREESNLSYQISQGLDVSSVMTDISAAVAKMHFGATVMCSDNTGVSQFMTQLTREITEKATIVDEAAVKLGLLPNPELRDRIQSAYIDLNRSLEARTNKGSVRIGHGDLHTGNIWFNDDNEIILLDAVEYNDEKITLDVFQDLAFLGLEFAMSGRDDLSDLLYQHYADANPIHADKNAYLFYLAERLLLKSFYIFTLDIPGTVGDDIKHKHQLNRGTNALRAAQRALGELGY